MNKDLYERYLQKKAKKLGVPVEELRQSAMQPSGQTQVPLQEQLPQQPLSQTPEQTQQPLPQQQTFSQTSFSEQRFYQEQTPEQPQQPLPPQQTFSQTSFPEAYQSQTQTSYTQDRRENKFCVIGYPLGHSLSSVIHKAGFKSLGIDAEYETLETPPENLVERIKYLKNNNYKGFNVTIPLKLPVALFIEEVDKSADIASAINTVVINPDRTMKGYNTDVIGFKRAIPQEFVTRGKTIGVLGTGGAAHAAAVALAEDGAKEIRFYTRSIPNSLELLNYMRKVFPAVQFEAYQIEYIRDLSMLDMLVNATPIGMQGRSADMTPVEKPQLMTLPKGAVVYDIIYNPKKTVLLRQAEELGLKTVNGIEMFIAQAACAEEIWTGRKPNTDAMKIALLENL